MHAGGSVAVSPSQQEKVKCWKGWLWSQDTQESSQLLNHRHPHPAATRLADPTNRIPRALQAQLSRGSWVTAGAGSLFPLRFMNAQSYIVNINSATT